MRGTTTAAAALLCVACDSFSVRAEPSAAPPRTIWAYDLTGVRTLDLADRAGRYDLWDTCHLVAALQGLVNRAEPRLYVQCIDPWDRYWLQRLRYPGEWLAGSEVKEIEDLERLLAHFRSAYRGVVLYDLEPRPLSNLASTIAGCEDLLPVRKDDRPGSIYRRFVAGGPRLPVVVDLTVQRFPAATGSVKCDAYRWAKERYLDTRRCDPGYLAYYIDTYWLADPFSGSHDNHTLTNHDFFIARKAFFFDLHPWDDEPPNDDPGQPVGTDAATLKAILRSAYDGTEGKTIIHAGGFVPWAWKYCNHVPGASTHGPVASEWRYAEILSCFNAIMDADALGPCAMANASFYTHYPLRERYPQALPPTEADLRRTGALDGDGLVSPGAYICFYVGDYDSAAWLYREFPRCWDDPARGEVALGWALNPNLERRAPMALVYARQTRTALDVFTAGDSGAGYLNPGYLAEPRRHSGLPSGLAAWESFCRDCYRRWDLTITGFIIDGNAPAMNEEVWDAYARFSGGGIVGQKMPPQGIHQGMPFLRMSDTDGSPDAAAAQFGAMVSPERRSFYYVRTILKTAGWHAAFARALERSGAPARVVEPHTFFNLLARYERDKARYPRPAWTKAAVSWTPEATDGIRVIPYVDGPIAETVEAGRRAVVSNAGGRIVYIYAAAHDGFSTGEAEDLTAEITYLDTRGGRFCVQYNGVESAYTASRWVSLAGSGEWKTVRIPLPNARFANQQNAAADFRLANDRGRLAIAGIAIRRGE